MPCLSIEENIIAVGPAGTMGIKPNETQVEHLDFNEHERDQEIEMFDVEKLKSLLPQGGKEAELTQLDIILEAIKYIRTLQEDLTHKTDKQ